MTDIVGVAGKSPLADSFSRDRCALIGYCCRRPAEELKAALFATGIGSRNALFIKRLIGVPYLPEMLREQAFATLGLDDGEINRLSTILIIRDFRNRSTDEQKEAISKLGLDEVNREYLNRLLWTVTDKEPYKELYGDMSSSPFRYLAGHTLVNIEREQGRNCYKVKPTMNLLEQLIGLRPTKRIEQEPDSGKTSFPSPLERPAGRLLTSITAVFGL